MQHIKTLAVVHSCYTNHERETPYGTRETVIKYFTRGAKGRTLETLDEEISLTSFLLLTYIYSQQLPSIHVTLAVNIHEEMRHWCK